MTTLFMLICAVLGYGAGRSEMIHRRDALLIRLLSSQGVDATKIVSVKIGKRSGQ